jgi:hypothetical protein
LQSDLSDSASRGPPNVSSGLHVDGPTHRSTRVERGAISRMN